MGKLDTSLGKNDNFNEKIQDNVKQQIDADTNGQKEVPLVAINQICLRYENNYINDKKTFEPLIKSIETNDLLQPIIIVDIDKYLPKAKPEEETYLKRMKKKYGCKYFVSSGHRRFKAYCSLAIKKTIFKDSDVINMYKEIETNDLYKKDSEARTKSDYKNVNKWLYIPAQITDDVIVEENVVYNDTNLTSRPTTNFEYVVNSIEPSGLDINSKSVADDLRSYIYNRYKIDVDKSSIYSYLQIIKTLPKEFIICIYDGELPIRDAKKLLNKITDKNKDEVLKEIKDGTFNYNSKFGSKHSKLSAKQKEIQKIKRYISKYGDIKLSELANRLSQ